MADMLRSAPQSDTGFMIYSAMLSMGSCIGTVHILCNHLKGGYKTFIGGFMRKKIAQNWVLLKLRRPTVVLLIL